MEKILETQRRFYRDEKNQFLESVEEKLNEYGFEFERKQFRGIFKSVNLETKSTAHSEYIFIAHYDTGTKMPFWFSWLMKLFGVNYQILIMILVVLFLRADFDKLPDILGYVFIVIQSIFVISIVLVFFPNRNNFDDNTSGIIALLQLAKKCKENGLDNVKFLFVDNEELGLFGSRAHRRDLRKRQLITPNSKIISIDCVGAGRIPLIIRNSKSHYEETFRKEFLNNYEICKSIRLILPVSDNYSFRKYGALNISFVNKAVIPNGYTIPKIHTSRDSSIDLNQIEKLTDVLADIVDKNSIEFE